jgi:hypothetical protein
MQCCFVVFRRPVSVADAPEALQRCIESGILSTWQADSCDLVAWALFRFNRAGRLLTDTGEVPVKLGLTAMRWRASDCKPEFDSWRLSPSSSPPYPMPLRPRPPPLTGPVPTAPPLLPARAPEREPRPLRPPLLPRTPSSRPQHLPAGPFQPARMSSTHAPELPAAGEGVAKDTTLIQST